MKRPTLNVIIAIPMKALSDLTYRKIYNLLVSLMVFISFINTLLIFVLSFCLWRKYFTGRLGASKCDSSKTKKSINELQSHGSLKQNNQNESN